MNRGVRCNTCVNRGFFSDGLRVAAFLAVVCGTVFLASVPASAAMIDEIGVGSIDTVFDSDTGVLTISQAGIGLLLERDDNSQEVMTGVDFSLVTTLEEDNSTPQRAMATFDGGTISISKDGTPLLTADITSFQVEEIPASIPFLIGWGDFLITGGTLSTEFGPAGVGDILDITWNLEPIIANFAADFTAESDVTLTPEPATLSLLGLGGMVILTQRKRRNAA